MLILVTLIGASATTSTALAAPSGASAWGQGASGKLGDGFEFNSFVPVAVSGLSGVRSVAASGSDSYALLEDGTVMAWGAGAEEFDSGTKADSDVPVPVRGLSQVRAIAAGGGDGLALLDDGTVMAWGDNESGQLGDGTTAGSNVPVPVGGLSEVTAIATSGDHALALLEDGTVEAWGANGFGQLGDGTTTGSDVPVPVGGLSEVTAISAGEYFSLAVLADGDVMAWGDNDLFGRAGLGTAEESLIPTPVCATEAEGGCASHLSGAAEVAAGDLGGLARLEDGRVMAWGVNTGDGTTTVSNVPVPVSGLSKVTAVAARSSNSLALLEDGTVMAWGRNQEGELGNSGAGDESLVPVPVSDLSGVTAIAAGYRYSLAAGTPPPAVPQVAAVEPAFGTGGGGKTVTIKGINFGGATAVRFGANAAGSFHVESPTSMTATVPPGTETVDVSVTTPEGTSPTSPGDRYRYNATVTGIAPHFGYPAGGTPVTITGTNFAEVTAVRFGTAESPSFTVESESRITAIAPPGGESVQVSVETQGGISPLPGAPAFSKFTYSPTPVIEGVGPNHGPPAGGTPVTIKGSNFTGATAVRFGSQAAKSFTVDSPTEITAVSPAFGGGNEDVVGIFVTTPFGTDTYTGCGTDEGRAFIYEPTITSIEPASGPAAGGTEVTIRGSAFKGTMRPEMPICSIEIPVAKWVNFGSIPAQNINVVSGSKITAVAPPGTGVVDVTVEDRFTLGEGSGSSPTVTADRFTFLGGPPSILAESASGITASTATLEAEIDPHGAPGGAFYQFQLLGGPGEGPDELRCPVSIPPAYSTCIGPDDATALPLGWISGDEPHAVRLDLAGAGVTLAPGRSYRFRVLAAEGVVNGASAEWKPTAVVGSGEEFTTPSTSAPPGRSDTCASTPSLCPPSQGEGGSSQSEPRPEGYGSCIRTVREAFVSARRAAGRTAGRARARATKRAERQKQKGIVRCRARFLD